MEITLEQVERLREKSGLSYEEARNLLEQTGGDVLEALIRLERQGRTHVGFYSTRPGGGAERAPLPTPVRTRRERDAGADRPGFKAQLKELLMAAWDLLRHSLVNQLEVWRNGEQMTSIPVLILILLVIVAFWITVPLLIIGLFFGCTYRFSGPDLSRAKVDQVMDRVSSTVSGAVDQVKDQVRQAVEKEKNKKK